MAVTSVRRWSSSPQLRRSDRPHQLECPCTARQVTAGENVPAMGGAVDVGARRHLPWQARGPEHDSGERNGVRAHSPVIYLHNSHQQQGFACVHNATQRSRTEQYNMPKVDQSSDRNWSKRINCMKGFGDVKRHSLINQRRTDTGRWATSTPNDRPTFIEQCVHCTIVRVSGTPRTPKSRPAPVGRTEHKKSNRGQRADAHRDSCGAASRPAGAPAGSQARTGGSQARKGVARATISPVAGVPAAC